MPERVAQPLRTALVAIILAAATLLLFSRSAGYGFVNYDDPRHVLNNVHVQAGFTVDGLRWAFTGHGDIWNPLVRLSHILDWTLFGDSARGHHLQSILWHSLNAALAFLLLRRLTGAFWRSACCAALFAWHPLRVESVTWISERKDVVSVAFGLLTLLAYTIYAERRAARGRTIAAYAFTLAAFTAALLSKPSMVTLPSLFLLLDFWPLQRFTFARPTAPAAPLSADPEPISLLLLEKLPFVALATLASFVVVRTQTAAGDFVLDLPLGARLTNALVSIPRYLGKFFWPFDLAIAYPHPGWWPASAIGAAGAFVLAVSLLAWRLRRVHPWLAVGWLWFLLALAPMSGVLQVGFQSLADRYSYFPLLGWQLALLWSLRAALPRFLPRWAGPTLAGLALLGCGLRTWDQQQHWSSSRALYEHALAVTEDNAPAHAFLAYTSAHENRADEARLHSDRALALEPDNS
ncbi:MAG TPA: glycosyltransferase family 39 protein, partial [Opitutaceae bacterium]|nr:glycosyltransferase family 39 protein [Opitutaceae bacterium]